MNLIMTKKLVDMYQLHSLKINFTNNFIIITKLRDTNATKKKDF